MGLSFYGQETRLACEPKIGTVAIYFGDNNQPTYFNYTKLTFPTSTFPSLFQYTGLDKRLQLTISRLFACIKPDNY